MTSVYNQQLLKTVLQRLPQTALYLFDQAFSLMGAEGAGLELQGFSPQMIGQTVWQVLGVDADLEAVCRATLAGEESTLEAACNNGARYSIQAFPLPGEDDEAPVGALLLQRIAQVQPVQDSVEKRLQNLLAEFEQVEQAMFVMDMEGQLMGVNAPAAEFMDRSREALIGASLLDFTSAAEREQVENTLSDLRRGGQKSRYEQTFVRSDNSRRIAEIVVTPVLDDAGNPCCIQGLMHNITLYKAAQQALRANEERHRTISALILDFAYAYRVNADGSLEQEWVTEDSLLRLSGWTVDELKPRGPFALFHPDDHAKLYELQQRVLQGEVVKDQHRIITKDGRIRWLYITRHPVWNEKAKRVVRYYGVAQDITERKQAEDALRKSEERYRILTDIIPGYAFDMLVHSDGSTTLDWITHSAFERLTGYKSADAVGLLDAALFHPDDRAIVHADIQRAIEGEDFTAEYRIITSDNETRWILMDYRPAWGAESTRVTHYYGIVREITHRKEAELTLRRSRDLLKEIQRITRVGGWEYDVASEKLWWTSQTNAIYGLPPDEQPDMERSISFFIPQHIPIIRKALTEAVEKGIAYDLELQITTAQNERIWIRTIGQPETVDGKVVRVFGSCQDIDQRKTVNVSLRESEERYRNLTELISDYAFAIRVYPDKQMELEWLTHDSFFRMTGYTVDQINRLQRVHLFHPHDRPMVAQDIDRALDGEAVSRECRIVTKTGEVRWIHIHRRPVWSEAEQRVTRLYGMAQDITERKEVEIALRESEERYRILTELMMDYAFSALVVDGHLETEWLTDDSYMRVTGYSRDEISGRSLIHPEDRQRVEMDRNRAIRGARVSTEYRIITKNNEVRWIQLNYYPVWDKTGREVLRMYGVGHDRTESKLAEEALRRSEERFRLIAQVTLDGLYDVDLAGNNYWMSDSYRHLVGLKTIPEDAFGWWGAHIHPDDAAAWHEHLDLIMSGKRTYWQNEYRMRHENQRHYVTLLDRGYAIPDESGKPERVIGALTDVTQAREVEKRKLELVLMEEKIRFFTNFVTAISHDFRTPLSIINTSAYIIERSPDQQARAEHVNQLKRQVEYIEKLVDGLLTIVQMDKPDAFRFEPVNMNMLLQYIRVSEEVAFNEKRLRLTFELDADLPSVIGDSNWLYRCLLNLLENARCYTDVDGEVRVSSLYDANDVIIKVQDSGIGIAPEHLGQIFAPLYRVKSHRPTDGQGLGLAIAWKIAEQHGGHITVESELNKGSTFTLVIPRDPDSDDSVRVH